MSQLSKNIPSGWAAPLLGDVIDFKYGKSLPAKTRNEGNYFVYGSNGIIGQHSTSLTKRPSLIIGRKGSIGEVHISEVPCWPIDTTYYVDELYEQPYRFWFYLLKSLNLSKLNRATALPGLNRNDAYSLKIKLPPLNEQKRIVERIEELQARSRRAQEALDTIPDLLDQLRQSILAAAFSGELTKEWRKQNPQVESAKELLKRIRAERRKRWEDAELKKLKDKSLTGKKLKEAFTARCKQYKEPLPANAENLPELPKGWCWASFSELSENHDNRRVPLEKSVRKKRNGKYRYYGASGVIDWIDAYIYDGSFLLIAEDGANLLSRSTPIAFQADGQFWVNNHAHVIQTFCEVPLGYLEQYFNSIDLEPYITGSAQPKLKQEKLNEIPIPVAPLSEQLYLAQFINKLIEHFHSILQNVKTMLDELAICDQSILNKAFQGRLVPQDPNDEPASVLLERIKQERVITRVKVKDKDKRKDKKMKRKIEEQRAILSILQESKRALSPEDVFSAACFDEADIDAFYEQLRNAISSKKVREIRKGSTIKLEAIAS